jgi:hypothetical protein
MQRLSSVLAGVVVVALFAGPFARPAQASDFDKLTYVTISGPVEIPGVALPAGTYIFKLADPDTGNRVVQVLSKDGKTVYATFFSLPETRPAPAGEKIVTLYEGGMAAGSPEAIKAWFYPGETTGFEFVYPREQAKKAASAN